jgi:hypothetical protein
VQALAVFPCAHAYDDTGPNPTTNAHAKIESGFLIFSIPKTFVEPYILQLLYLTTRRRTILVVAVGNFLQTNFHCLLKVFKRDELFSSVLKFTFDVTIIPNPKTDAS